MPGADGYITYKTDLDNKELEKELAKTTKDIMSMEKQALKDSGKRLPIAKQVEDLGIRLDEAKAKLAALQDEAQRAAAAVAGASANDPGSIAAYTEAAARQPALEKDILAAQKAVDRLQPKFDKAADRLEEMDRNAATLAENLAAARDKAGGIAKKLSEPASAGEKMGSAIAHADKQMGLFTDRIRGLAKRVFIFSVITAALRSLRSWMSKVIQSNSEAAAAVARLKGALLTMAQPLVAVVIPAFITLVNILTRVVTAIAGLVSLLFGKTIDQSREAAEGLQSEADALSATGKAADKASKSMAGFDEINQLSGGASGGGGASVPAPDFSFDTKSMELDFQKLLNWIKLIGAALLAWKLADGFLDGIKKFVGLIIAINGAIDLAKGAWDAWQNGLNADNLKEMLLGALELAGGLAIAFGKVGAGVGLLVGGLTILITSIHDAMENGWNAYNLLGSIAGLLMTGLGISLLTGSWIPLLIAGIAGIVLAFTVAFGQGEALLGGIKTLLEGFKDFFKGVFTQDLALTLQGIGEMVQGIQTIIGAVLGALQTAIDEFFLWLDEVTGGRISGFLEWVHQLLTDFITTLSQTLTGMVDSIGQILSGIVTFISGVFAGDWRRAWDGIKDILKGIWNLMVGVIEGAINLVIDLVNSMIAAFNRAFSVMRELTGFPPIIHEMDHVEIPRLAKGAVIPPNREFLAVLGDQKSGTNIETPLATMVQAFRQALSEGGYNSGGSEAYLVLDEEILGKIVYRLNKAETNRVGVSLAEEG